MRLAACISLAIGAAGCGGSPARVAETPAPEPVPPAPAPAAAPADDGWRDIVVCVADAEGARDVPARYNVVTGDTLVDGRPFAEAFPLTDAYAANAPWYIANEGIDYGPAWYGKYGIPRVVAANEARRVRDFRGVLVFTERDDPGEPYSALYVAVRPGCEFQPYSWDLLIGGVRG